MVAACPPRVSVAAGGDGGGRCPPRTHPAPKALRAQADAEDSRRAVPRATTGGAAKAGVHLPLRGANALPLRCSEPGASLTIAHPVAPHRGDRVVLFCRQQAAAMPARRALRPGRCARAEASARASVRLDRQAAGHGEALDGGRRQSARGGGRLPDPAAGRLGRRRGDRGATGPRTHRTAVVGHRRRRVPAAARRQGEAPHRVRRPRDRPRGGKARPLPQERQAAGLLRRGGRRQVGRRARHRPVARSRASQARSSEVGDALRAGDRAGRERLRAVAAAAFAARGREIHDAAAAARVLLRRERQGAAGRHVAAQSGVCADAARDRRRRRGRVLHG